MSSATHNLRKSNFYTCTFKLFLIEIILLIKNTVFTVVVISSIILLTKTGKAFGKHLFKKYYFDKI
jgi:hypothetical protein